MNERFVPPTEIVWLEDPTGMACAATAGVDEPLELAGAFGDAVDEAAE